MSNEFDKRYPRISNRKALKPEDRAIVSKLVTPTNTVPGLQGSDREFSLPDFSIMSRVAHRTASNITDAKNMFQVLPDMDLARQILVSAILSPTDLTSSNLLYTVAGDNLDSNLTGPMLREIQTYFTTVYKINELLPQILDDALFMKGSYPLMVLPESTIDHAINSTGRVNMESIADLVDPTGWYRTLGIVGPSTTSGSKKYNTALEAFGDEVSFSSAHPKEKYQTKISSIELDKKKITMESSYQVTDNPHVLKNPLLLDRLRKQRIGDVYGVKLRKAAMEATKSEPLTSELKSTEKRSPLSEIQRTFYLNRQYSQVPLQPLLTPNQLSKDSVGHPIVMHLPSEAVVPVHVPGNPRQHVGYFVLLDVNGHPVTLSGRDDFYSDIRSSMAKNPDMASHLLNMTRRATFGREDWNTVEINEMARNYGQIVEQDLLNRLRNGLTHGEYEFSRSDEINRLMFSRAMSQKNTLMLFVPVELMTYIAFDYNEYGVGKSLLEDGKILASLRATLLFANTMAAVKNATGTQTINIELSPDDGDPYSTVEFMLNMYAKLNREGFPIGDTHPADLINHLQNAGKNIVVTGNPAFPEVKFDVQARDGSHKVIDTELEEILRKRHIQLFGLTPETMEAASGADFATQVVNNFLMLLKRVVHYQKEFKPFLEDFHRNYILNSGHLMETLRAIVEENKRFLGKEFKDSASGVDDFVHAFVMALQVELPSPETNRLREQMEAFQAYTDAITTAIDAYFSEEMLDSTAAQSLHESVPTTRAALIAHFRRKWLRENGVLLELDVFNTMEEEDGPALNLLEEMDAYNEGLLRSVETYMKRVHKAALDRKKRLDKENESYDAAMGGGDPYDSSSTETGDGFDDSTGQDDFNDDPMGGDDVDGLDGDGGADDGGADLAGTDVEEEIDLGDTGGDLDTGGDELSGVDDIDVADDVDVADSVDAPAPAATRSVPDEASEEADLDVETPPVEESDSVADDIEAKEDEHEQRLKEKQEREDEKERERLEKEKEKEEEAKKKAEEDDKE